MAGWDMQGTPVRAAQMKGMFSVRKGYASRKKTVRKYILVTGALLLFLFLRPFLYTPFQDILIPSQYKEFTLIHTATKPSFPMYVYRNRSRDIISRSLALTKMWDVVGTALLQRTVDTLGNETVIDFGANLGWFALLAAARGVRVVAIEPVRDNIRALQRSADAGEINSKQMVVVHAALGASKSLRKACLDRMRRDDGNFGNAVLYEAEKVDGCRDVVPITTLDKVVPVGRAVSFLKADCEGCEASALLGGERLLLGPNAPCVIYAEWFPRLIRATHEEGTAHIDQVAALLSTAGYDLFEAVRESAIDDSLHFVGPVAGDLYHNFFLKAHRIVVALQASPRCFPQHSHRRRHLLRDIEAFGKRT